MAPQNEAKKLSESARQGRTGDGQRRNLPYSKARKRHSRRRLERIVELDQRLLRRLVRHRTGAVTLVFQTLCRLLDTDLVPVWIALFAVAGQSDVAEQSTLSLGSASLLVVLLKRMVKRNRPALELHVGVAPDQFSFPSGHTAAAVALAVVLLPSLAAPPLAVFAVCVGYARLYLGVHYPLDVLAGAAVGLVVGSSITVFF